MRLNSGWTEEQLAYVIEHYPYERTEDIAEKIGKTKSSIDHKANNLGLYKDPKSLFNIKSTSKKGDKAWNYKGYRRRSPKGYILRYVPDHPMASKDGLVMEHRLVMEKHLGCILPKSMTVHHINGIKDDNRIENLAVMTISAHITLHNKRGDRHHKRGKESPLYIAFDVEEAKAMKANGASVKEVCEHFGIGKTKYYSEMRNAG